ncbi:Clavaminate synthase-like protein [Polyplosphaeria fusca]|uniref:Clavaminate synthase-like protein n=1 Tax=Polyplosphaeria fusca TaxID=682080 RepID=A0A9P4UWW4_9PLEO|nr:Clavaminate synthase-like protein [Polyplosphaeria fusca]
MTETETPVPIVDFRLFLNGDKAEKETVARQIDEAFRDVGFVYLKNHGVAQDMVEQCFEWSKTFFALPLPTKLLAPHPPGGSHHRGYSSPGLENVTQHTYDEAELSTLRKTTPDFKESFESGNTTDASQPNIWPPDTALPGFRTFMEAFFPHCATLIHHLLSALSVALGVPDLAPTHAQSLFQLRLLHYPPIAVEQLREGRKRINAHSDFGTLTLLWQDGVGGLEIQDPREEGRWREVRPLEGGVLVNVGDLLERWSNGRWRSTVHRVGLPPAKGVREEREGGKGNGGEGEKVVGDRYSIPFFATADPETVIEALPGCWVEGREETKRFEKVTAEGYVRMRMAALYE